MKPLLPQASSRHLVVQYGSVSSRKHRKSDPVRTQSLQLRNDLCANRAKRVKTTSGTREEEKIRNDWKRYETMGRDKIGREYVAPRTRKPVPSRLKQVTPQLRLEEQV